MNRDLDDRILPPGEYRDALNVNIGRSEGADVGAVENLKGNEEVTGQTDIGGTTIGQVVDPANDNIYWFTTDDSQDSIYEFDGTTVSPIVIDRRTADVPLPMCTPFLQSRVTGPDGGAAGDPLLPAIPPTVNSLTNDGPANFAFGGSGTVTWTATAVAGSSPITQYVWSDSVVTAVNTRSITVTGDEIEGEGAGGSLSRDLSVIARAGDADSASSNVSTGTWNEANPPAFSVSAGADQATTAGGTVTFTARHSNALGNVTYQWNTGGADIAGATNASYTTPALNTVGTFTYTVTATDDGAPGRTASDTVDVVVGAAPVPLSITAALAVGQQGSVASGSNVNLVSTPDGGSRTYSSFQWQSRVGGGAFANIAGATNQNLTATNVTQATDYRVTVTDSDGDSATSNTVAITIAATPQGTIRFTSAGPANTTVAGTSTQDGDQGTPFTDIISNIQANSGFTLSNANFALSGGDNTYRGSLALRSATDRTQPYAAGAESVRIVGNFPTNALSPQNITGTWTGTVTASTQSFTISYRADQSAFSTSRLSSSAPTDGSWSGTVLPSSTTSNQVNLAAFLTSLNGIELRGFDDNTGIANGSDVFCLGVISGTNYIVMGSKGRYETSVGSGRFQSSLTINSVTELI